jgi:hypothetical protein
MFLSILTVQWTAASQKTESNTYFVTRDIVADIHPVKMADQIFGSNGFNADRKQIKI